MHSDITVKENSDQARDFKTELPLSNKNPRRNSFGYDDDLEEGYRKPYERKREGRGYNRDYGYVV
jgi:hypothetical protein